MYKLVILLYLCCLHVAIGNSNLGPDPWDYVKEDTSSIETNYMDVPPDLRLPLKKKIKPDGNMGNGEWFFKRALAIILNGGQTKMNSDGSVDISLQMKLEPENWQTLNEYTKSHTALNEDMFRRSIAYVEGAIYKPSITEKITMAWSEYVKIFFMENKTYIVWCFGILAAMGMSLWLWKHISHKHIVILIVLLLYLYEVFISYKEAEKEELDRFMAAVNKCSWYFWKSSCDISPPDPIIFLKHMNPMKIGLRMFTTILSEPMVALSGTVNTMVEDITDKMWFPFNIILNSILIIFINIMLIMFLIMIIFNYILNIPFNLSLLGLGSVQVKQRKRTVNFNSSNSQAQPIETSDRISGATLDRILDVFSRALDNSTNTPKIGLNEISNHVPKLKRSSSTGRLPDSLSKNRTFSSSPVRSEGKGDVAPYMIGGGDSSKVPEGWQRGPWRRRTPGATSSGAIPDR